MAGYYGKWFESTSSWITNVLMALPGIVVLLAARAVLGPSLWTIMVIFGILLAPAFYRLVVAAVSGVRHELFVDAARVSGVSDARIIARHILTVVRAPIIIQASIVAGIAIAIQAGLDFLGLGDPTIPDLGQHAERRLHQPVPRPAAGPVAGPCDRADLYRVHLVRQRAAR